jgi:copper oxidase (laccase) domain-containing protein
MKKNFNSDYKNITIWLGPGIKSCHFEVQQDVLSLFEKKFKIAIIKKDNRYFIDLPLAIKKSLFLNGIKKQQIIEHPDCTFCLRSQYFSFRRDKPSLVEANAFIIHLKK